MLFSAGVELQQDESGELLKPMRSFLSYLYIYTCFTRRYFIEVSLHIREFWSGLGSERLDLLEDGCISCTDIKVSEPKPSVTRDSRRVSNGPYRLAGGGDGSLSGVRFGRRTEPTPSAAPRGPIRIRRLRGIEPNSSFKLTALIGPLRSI